LLNADWNDKNKPPHRTVNLHRHPVFFGNVRDVVGDCCGYCPAPLNDEEKKVAEEEGKIYVKGPVTFLSDDPGRQEIGSFHPLGPEDYTDMAYVGSSQVLCEAIVDNDLSVVRSWCEQEGVNTNVRDFCGRTPLHLACMSTSTGLDVVQCLIDHGARLVARLQDGRTALHLAAARGRADIVAALLRKSAENEHERDERQRLEKLKSLGGTAAVTDDIDIKEAAQSVETPDAGESDDGYSHIDAESTIGGAATETTSGFVKLKSPLEDALAADGLIDGEEELVDDIYDINITDWDYLMSPLHHAILMGQNSVIETLVSDFGADIRAPILAREGGYGNANALLNLVLALNLPKEMRCETIAAMLKVGASSAQVTNNRDGSRTSALHYLVSAGAKDALDTVFEHDQPNAMSVLNNMHRPSYHSFHNPGIISPLINAMIVGDGAFQLTKFLLERGAHVQITVSDIVRNLKPAQRKDLTAADLAHEVKAKVQQPLEQAIVSDMGAEWVELLLKHGADPNVVLIQDLRWWNKSSPMPVDAKTSLDMVRFKIEKCWAAIKETNYTSTKNTSSAAATDFDDSVLTLYPEGSYRHFTAERYLHRLRNGKKAPKATLSYHEREEKQKALKNKACKEVLEELVKVEKLLVDFGAKTFLEAYPERLPEYLIAHSGVIEMFRRPPAEVAAERAREEKLLAENTNAIAAVAATAAAASAASADPKVPKFEPFKLDHPYLGEGDVLGGYLRLFEAVWNGTPDDMETVRILTSGPSGEGENRVPALRVSVSDRNNFNALFIALYRGNFDMADLIMEIVKDQYELIKPAPVHPVLKDDSDEDSDVEKMEIPVSFEEPAVDDSGTEQNLVKCGISPYVSSSASSILNMLTSAAIHPGLGSQCTLPPD
jgi:ankyrin repeat protein